MQTDETLLANNSQHYWMLPVTSLCIPCCRLLRVVGSCCARFETGQTFELTTPSFFFAPRSLKHSATMLNPFAKLYYWGQACPLHMDFGFELSDQFSFAHFYLFTMGISTRIILLEGLEYLFKTAYSFLRTVGLELLKLNENSYQYLKSFVS